MTDNKKITTIRVIAIFFLIAVTFNLIINIVAYFLIVNNSIKAPSSVDVGILILDALALFIYTLIVGYGLYKLRRWVLYIFIIPVLWFFCWGIVYFILYGLPLISISDLVADIILGIVAIFVRES